jgi:hypothetical protein
MGEQKMRKVTETVATAFQRGHHKTLDNTSTDGRVLRLHGHAIARKTDAGGVEISTAGWNTVTTRERLNGIMRTYGVNGHVSQRDFGLYFNGQPWDGSWMPIL